MAAGTGNLILKRGVNMPYDSGQDGGGQETPPVLLQGMPAAQIIGSIWGLTAGNNAIVPGYAFDNYPNRLWIGTDRYAKDNTSYGGGNETFDDIGVSIEPYIGGSEPTHPDIHETRPIWMGAEIRAYTPLFEDTSDGSTGSSGSYVVLKADWDRPSDYVLATQKAISRMPLRYFSTVTVNPGGPTSPYTPYIEFSGWNGSTDGALARSTQYLFPSSNAPTAGHVLKINTVTSGNVPGAQIVKLEWASAGSATGTMSNFSIAGDTGTSQQVDDAETITFTGGTGIDTVASATNTITFNLDLNELTTGTVAIDDLLAGVDATDNSSDKFTIGSVLGLLSSDVSVNTTTGAATVSATNVKAAATTDTTTFLALLENNSASAQQVKYDSDLAYNADTNTLSVTNVNATTITGTVSTATNANNINISATTSTDTATSIVLVGAQTAGNQSPFIDAGLTYNANTNTLTVSGGAVIGGDLTVNGTTTTINTTNLNVEDTIVTLNYGYAGSVPLDSGIEIERGSLSNVQMSWDESSKHWHAEIIDKNNVFSGGTTAKIGHYPLILADNTDPSTETKYANSPSGAPAGTQYVHTLDVKNLVMSGTWTLGASIQTDVNLSGGGLVLPYTTDVAAEENETQEGRVYWDTSLDLMTVGTGSVYKTMVDTDSTQTLSNKTLTTPKIVNDGYIADGNGNEQIIFKTTSSAVNEITITNAASGSSPLIASSGVNSNIDLRLQGKGTGTVVIDDSAINTTSTTFSVFNTTATSVSAFGAATSLTLGAVAAAATINIGTGNHPNGTTKAINIGTGSNNSNTTTTVTIGSGTATTGATCSVLLGCPNAANTNVYVQSNRLVFGTTTSNRPVLSGAATTNSTVVHTLPNVNSGNVVIASTTNFNLSNYILMGGGSSSPSVYTNKDTVVVGGVKVNFQNSTPTNTRYPVPFLGSNRSTSTTAPSSFSTTTDGTYTDSYLYANLGNGTASGTPTNYTTGLFYEVNDSQDSTVGTLFCDYIGATLDCGTY